MNSRTTGAHRNLKRQILGSKLSPRSGRRVLDEIAESPTGQESSTWIPRLASLAVASVLPFSPGPDKRVRRMLVMTLRYAVTE